MTMSNFYPPKGTNFGCESLISIEMLQRDLNRIVSFLQSKFPSTSLIRYTDWWQHDGCHFSCEGIDWNNLLSVVKSSRLMFDLMTDDDYVRIGIAPVDKNWYLRFWVEWGFCDEDFLMGDYDVIVPSDFVEEFREKVVSTLEANLIEAQAPDCYLQFINQAS